jgi:hypothetical protein
MANEFPPYGAFPSLTLHESINRDHLDASKIAGNWFASLSKQLQDGRLGDLSDLFLEDHSWWRDIMGLSWDITSKEGTKAIKNYLGASTAGFGQLEPIQPGALQPQLAEMGPMIFIQAGFTFQTKIGSGRGILRLANVDPETWKAWTVFTQLERLVGQDEIEAQKLKSSGDQSARSQPFDMSDIKSDIEGPEVLVVGAGESLQCC